MDYSKSNREYTSIPQATVGTVTNSASSTTANTSPFTVPDSRSNPNAFQWGFLLTLRFLHPFAWFAFFCIGGPLMIHLLDYNLLLKSNPVDYFDGSSRFADFDRLTCDIQAPWATLFQINIRTPYLSFNSAKLIDVTFDLLVGRGGQAILAWLSYRVYTDVFIYLASRQPLSYRLLVAATTEPTSLPSFVSYISATFSKRGVKATLLWVLVTASYCLAYPTIVSASTSLVSASTTSISLPNGGSVKNRDYMNSAAYKITHSGLTDKQDPWFVYTSDIHRLPPKAWKHHILYINAWEYSSSDRDDHFKVNSTTYTISNGTIFDSGFYYGGNFYPAEGKAGKVWHNRTICLPDGNRYQWGASYELLTIIVTCQILWSAAMLSIWTYARGHDTTLVGERSEMGLYTAMLLLAEPLRNELRERAEDPQKIQLEGKFRSEKELRAIAKAMEPVIYEDMSLRPL